MSTPLSPPSAGAVPLVTPDGPLGDMGVACQDDLERLMASIARTKAQREGYQMRAYFPAEGPYRRDLYVKHLAFMAAGKTHRERLFLAGNRVGKCSTANTLIDTPDGRIALGVLMSRGLPFSVIAWDGQRRVVAQASAPFQKAGKHECYRLTMADGQSVEVADEHFILTTAAWQPLSRLLQRSVAGLPASTWVGDPLVRAEDGHYSAETRQGSAQCCSLDLRHGDALLRREEENDLAFARLRVDAQPHIPAWWCKDGLDDKGTSSRRLFGVLLSIRDGLRQVVDQCVACGDRIADSILPRWNALSLAAAPLPVALPALLRLIDGDRSHWLPTIQRQPVDALGLSALVLSPDNRIVSVEPIGSQKVYDFEVETYHNYVAGDLVHHNTSVGAYETVCHLTGLYPDWWAGHRFEGPIRAWAAGDTNKTVYDIIQVALVGPVGEIGSGMIPAHTIAHISHKPAAAGAVDTIWVRHVSGKRSSISLKSYEQGRIAFQGTAMDLIWLDEEPPQEIFTECAIRTMTTDGRVVMTFTPLSGTTRLISDFMRQAAEDALAPVEAQTYAAFVQKQPVSTDGLRVQ